GLLKGGLLRQEAEAPPDTARLEYGLAALAGVRLTIELARKASEATFSFYSMLPRAERRLLVALAQKTGNGWKKTYSVGIEEHCNAIATTLKNLGADVEEGNGD